MAQSVPDAAVRTGRHLCRPAPSPGLSSWAENGTPSNSSLGVQAQRSVENVLRRDPDVTMNEGNLRNRTDSGPDSLAVLRRLALYLAQITEEKQTGSMCGKLEGAGRDRRHALKPIRPTGCLSESRNA